MKKKKHRILFVCLGNICRSPSAEGIMKAMIEEKGLSDSFYIDSAGTSGWHEGDLPDKRMRQHASLRGYTLDSRSRPVYLTDFEDFDLIIGMDDANVAELKKRAPDLPSVYKIRKMTEYNRTYDYDHVPDPYYGGASGFELVLNLLEEACSNLLEDLSSTPDN